MGAPRAREGLPGAQLQPSAWLGRGVCHPPSTCSNRGGTHTPVLTAPGRGTRGAPWPLHTPTRTLQALHTEASGYKSTQASSTPLCAHPCPIACAQAPVAVGKAGVDTPAVLSGCTPCITPCTLPLCMHLLHHPMHPLRACPPPCTPLPCPHVLPSPQGSAEAGLSPRRDCPLTLYGVAEAVALQGLGAGLPGQTQKGWSTLHHTEIQHGACTALWGHREPGWAPSACLCPRPHGRRHSRVRARLDTDSPMLLAYWAVTVTMYSVPACSPRSTALVSRGPRLTWAGTVSPPCHSQAMQWVVRAPGKSEQAGGHTHLLPLCHNRLPQPCQGHVLHPVAGDGATGRRPADPQLVEAPLQDLQVGGASMAQPICQGAQQLSASGCVGWQGELVRVAQLRAQQNRMTRRVFWGGWVLNVHPQ